VRDCIRFTSKNHKVRCAVEFGVEWKFLTRKEKTVRTEFKFLMALNAETLEHLPSPTLSANMEVDVGRGGGKACSDNTANGTDTQDGYSHLISSLIA